MNKHTDRSGEMVHVRVSLDGCDDSTCMDLDVTGAELAFLKRLKALSEAKSEYGCMPTLDVSEDR